MNINVKHFQSRDSTPVRTFSPALPSRFWHLSDGGGGYRTESAPAKKCRKQFQFSDLFSIRFTEGMCVVNDVVVEQSSGVYPSSPIPVRSVKQTEIKLIAWLHCLVPLFSPGKDVERNFQSEEHFSGDSRFRQVCDRLTVIIIIHPVRTLDLAACLGSANEIKT